MDFLYTLRDTLLVTIFFYIIVYCAIRFARSPKWVRDSEEVQRIMDKFPD